MNKWCAIAEVDGKQVLFTHVYNSDDEKYEIRITVDGDDFFPGHGLAQASIVFGRSDKPFDPKAIVELSAPDKAKVCVGALVEETSRILTGLS